MKNRDEKLEYFKSQRKEQYDCALEITGAINNGHKLVCVDAPVKSGKREIKEVLSLMYARENRKFYCITSLNRKDTKNQRIELENEYGIKPIILTDDNAVEEAKKTLGQSKDPIVLFDESDYGTGSKQKFIKLYSFCKNKGMPVIGFSATNEEMIFSEKVDFTCYFCPNENYRGAEWFLSQNLSYEAQPFVKDGELSTQAIKLVDELMLSEKKCFGVVRFADKTSATKRSDIVQLLKQRYPGLTTRWVGEDSPFIWDNSDQASWKGHVYNFQTHSKKTLIIIHQTSTRSTEWGMHDYVQFYHDFRSSSKITKTACNTILQAILRVAHYDDIGHNIQVFTDLNVLKIAAEKDSLVRRWKGGELKKKDLQKHIDELFNNTERLPTNRVRRIPSGTRNVEYFHLMNVSSEDSKTLIKEKGRGARGTSIDKIVKIFDLMKKTYGLDLIDTIYEQINSPAVRKGVYDKESKYKWARPFHRFGIERVNEILKSDLSVEKKLEKLKDPKNSEVDLADGIFPSEIIGFQYSSTNSSDICIHGINESGGSVGSVISVLVYDNPHENHKGSYEDLKIKHPEILCSVIVPNEQVLQPEPFRVSGAFGNQCNSAIQN